MTARAVQVEGIAGGTPIDVTFPAGGTTDINIVEYLSVPVGPANPIDIQGSISSGQSTPNDGRANTPGLPTVSQLHGFNAGATWDRLRSAADNGDALAAIALGVQRTLAEGMVFNGTTWDRARGNTTSGARVSMERATLVQAGNPAANTALTLTLPAAGAGLFHYITHIYIARVATAALAGGAILEITTTNLNGIRWATGNQHSITVATTNQNVVTDADYTHPLRSAVANTATTIVMPAPGAAVSWRAWCAYYTGP